MHYLDFINLCVCLIYLAIASVYFKLPLRLIFLMVLGFFLPFLVNSVFIRPEYMPDQFLYFSAINKIRTFDFELIDAKLAVKTSAFLLAFIPLPFVKTIYSVALMNRLLYSALFVILYRLKILNKMTAIFFLIYPSALLYSSLALRDTLIVFFMILGFVFIIRKKPTFALTATLPLILIKPQNFCIELLFLYLYSIVKLDRQTIKFSRSFFLIITTLIMGILMFDEFITSINAFRMSFHLENGGTNSDFYEIVNFLEFIQMFFMGSLNFFFTPFFWKADDAYQFIQSVENLILASIISSLIIIKFKANVRVAIYWLSFLLLSSGIYGIVVENTGTLMRYKFPFILIYIIFINYDTLTRSSLVNRDRNAKQ